MNKKLALALIASLCVVNACGDDSSKPGTEDLSCQAEGFKSWCKTATSYTVCEDNQIVIKDCDGEQICNFGECRDKPAEGETCACDPADFKGYCTSATTYSACEDNEIVDKTCDAEQVCNLGECKPKPVEKDPCTPGSYRSLCEDGTHRTLCSEDGKIEIEACPADTTCVDGNCKGENTECNEVGCACDSSFQNSCDDTKRIACDNGIITEYDCAADGLTCHEGECYVVGQLACDNTFKNKCIGNNLLSCTENRLPLQQDETCQEPMGYLSLDRCNEINGGICSTISGITDCYEPCTTEGEILYDHCGYYDRKASKLTCTKTDTGLFYIPSEAECISCGEMIPGYGFDSMERGSICATEQCTYQEEASCTGNKASTCSSEGDRITFDCGQDKCVVYGDKALCAEECTANLKDTHKYSCDLHFENSEGLYGQYSSKDYVCTQVGEKYYWILRSEDLCQNGCDSTTNSCKKLHADEGKSCTEYGEYATRCADNILLTCSLQYEENPLGPGEDPIETYVWRACNCTVSNSDCIEYEDENDGTWAVCMEKCTAEDVNKPQVVCKDGRDGVYSSGRECVEIEGKYYWQNYAKDCAFGCDDKTGQCIKAHEDEGKTCSPTAAPRCVNDDVVLFCEEVNDGVYQYYALSCKYYQSNSITTCNSNATSGSYGNVTAMLEAVCDNSCTEQDATEERIQKHWNSSINELEAYVCEGDNDYGYYWTYDYQSSIECTHGYDATNETCVSIHTDEFTSCDSYTENHCDGSIYLDCEFGRFVAKECSDQCNDLIGCYESCEVLNEGKYQCGGDKNEYSFYYNCIEDDASGVKLYDRHVYDYCGDGGCVPYTGMCRW